MHPQPDLLKTIDGFSKGMDEWATRASSLEPILKVSNLAQEYRNGASTIQVLRGVDLNIHTGEMVAIMGPSGSGKSTLLSILGLFLAPTSGGYTVMGRDVLSLDRFQQPEFRRNFVGFVFQSCNLIENSTVYENLEYPLIYSGTKRTERPKRIHEALYRVGLGHRLHHPANLLSGGEQQRVAVARALVNRPRILLADEPTGQLDRKNSLMIIEHLERLAAEGETAVVVVTHDEEVAARCKRICLLEDGLLRAG
jgi:putative ABC transport system ATP-binding protein